MLYISDTIQEISQTNIKTTEKKCEGRGIPIQDNFLYTLSFADDQVVTAHDEENLCYMLRKLEKEYTKNGLEINLENTEYLTTEQESVRNLERDDDRESTGTEKFKYLGFILSRNGITEPDIISRLAQIRTYIKQMNGVLWNRQITRNTKKRIYNTLVRSIMTYRAENWVINKRNRSKITAS
ncbi:unnamed protein product [Diabrotica balteata]|uniref:Reverse transcriptase domain-containing protein n=1 Tax=Diabrotica balteata TaxID=107213 RepID=A0A9N9T6W2_DIABA|nr:unnamed protein product [Diabrotica balteata]